ncbi:DUF72 domain-containing protein [Pseudofrankia inefficax]|uniref:Sensor histidine kinase n=1 Tax=Pseudofrankia inefficax (strain DSM 45817 / CECT 9037 / DDB 130130 / EuI1c) TaxID=298654 RepID=E3J8I7_PSEI1|nr:DUF72 domain-containing protein [Pseudofrankia inefficax]ADP84521.1 protein of unknown function DUF72 [Pseudofrankia inefficax]
MANLYIGTSGWSYDHWDGVLYPAGTPPRQRLEIYTRHFDTVELNASFYRWPSDAAFASWRRRLPAGFTMSVKAPRGLTHAKRLHSPEAWTGRIIAGWHELGERRAVVLVQLDARQTRDDARLEYFLAGIPPWLRLAVELRHASWHTEPVYALLERHQAAYCVVSGAGLPCVLRATTSFVYVRLHGPDHDALYAGSYSDDDLRWWRDRIAEWRAGGLDVYAYFNNDGHGHAVRNARTLSALCGVPAPTT